MKFLMKLALDGITPSERILHSPPIGNVLSGFLRMTEKLYKHLFYSRINRFLEKKANGPKTAWVPIIKATTHIENNVAHYSLKGRSILCVGGQAKHYPIYHDLVEAAGGHLVTFHGNPNDYIDQLHQRLEKADMVICPVDCVNHEAYFTVKRYCQHSGKHCVLLDRSQIATFRKGIKKLATMTTEKAKS